jgi:large subunit ribosomal protein L23
MAIFKTKTASKEVKKEGTKATKALTVKAETVSATTPKSGRLDLAMVLTRPHVTEKASDLSERGVYAFVVNKLANKMEVRQAIEKIYKVKPVKIAIVLGKPKLMKNPRTGRVQVKKQGLKKALVYLKKGDKIELI